MIFDFNKVCLTSNQWVNNFRKGIIEYLGEEQVTKDAEEFYKNIPTEVYPIMNFLSDNLRYFPIEAKEKVSKYINSVVKYRKTISKEYVALLLDLVSQYENIGVGKDNNLGHQSGMWVMKKVLGDEDSKKDFSLSRPSTKPYQGLHHVTGNIDYRFYDSDFRCDKTLTSLENIAVMYLPKIIHDINYPEPDFSDDAYEEYCIKQELKGKPQDIIQDFYKWRLFNFRIWEAYGSKFQGVLEELAEENNPLFIDYKYDSRGRIYAGSHTSNFTSNKYIRGAIAFKEGVLIEGGFEEVE